MSFTLNQVAQRAGGGDIVRTKKIESAEPVVGRGADCDIQIPDLAVSLRHAVMRQLGRGRIEIKALGQLGFEANGAFTKDARLSLVDTSKLVFGSHELNFSLGSAPDEIVVTLSRSDSAEAEPEVQDEKAVFRFGSSMFSRRRAAWALFAMVLILSLVVPVVVYVIYRNAPVTASTQTFPRADVQWESGRLSPGHSFLESNCQACHQKAFVAVRDDACLACHREGLKKQLAVALESRLRNAGSTLGPLPARDHAPADRLAKAVPASGNAVAKVQATVSRLFNHPAGRCESCHTEHVGPAKVRDIKRVTVTQLVQFDCSECHVSLKEHLPDTPLLDVHDWEHHPDFRPLLTTSPSGPRVERIALSDHPRESNGLIFPHDLHLSKTGGVARMAGELGSAQGYGKSLECANCHRADVGGPGYKPVEMVRDCSACHSLAYARRGGKTMMLKHGDPKQVVMQLKAFYASVDSPMTASTGLLRRQPAFGAMATQRSPDAVARAVRVAFVPSQAHNRDRGGICYTCHTVLEPEDSASLDFDIVHPHLLTRYLPRGGFDHRVRAHRVDASGRPICGSCHKAESSRRSGDVLLPPIARCAACHGQSRNTRPMAASSTCTECHGYHQPGTPMMAMHVDWTNKVRSRSAEK